VEPEEGRRWIASRGWAAAVKLPHEKA